MSEIQNRKSARSPRASALMIHAAGFYIIWAVWTVIIGPCLKGCLPSQFCYDVIHNVFKVIVWTIPAAILIRKFEPVLPISLKQMFTQKVPLKAVAFWVAVMTAYGFLAIYKQMVFSGFGRYKLIANPNYTLAGNLWIWNVGITEELVFRGWYLNATAKDIKDWKRILLNTAMFIAIHFPTWFNQGRLLYVWLDGSALIVGMFSVLISICFLKHKNVLLPLVLHTLYDIIVTYFYLS